MYLENRNLKGIHFVRGAVREEVERIRAQHPIEAIVAAYTDLRPSGRTLKGRCPLPGHEDIHPSFTVYPQDQHFYCFGCNRGGDVFTFLELVEQITFREVMEKLSADQFTVVPRPVLSPRNRHSAVTARLSPETYASPLSALNESQTRMLTATATLYHATLLTHPEMLAYVQGRGVSLEMVHRYRVGYATGRDLSNYWQWRGWDLKKARELDLINDRGEFFANRIIFPERRNGQVVYLVGRVTDEKQQPKYLGLHNAPKPLYGLEGVRGSSEVFIVEGPFDWLTLLQWGYPAVALVGSHMKGEWADQLAFAERVYIVTDSDAPGRASADELARLLGERAIIVPPLPAAKDVNELAQRADAREVFAGLVQSAPRTKVRAKRHRYEQMYLPTMQPSTN